MTRIGFGIAYLLIAIAFAVFRWSYLSARYAGARERSTNAAAALVNGALWPATLVLEVLGLLAGFGRTLGEYQRDRKKR